MVSKLRPCHWKVMPSHPKPKAHLQLSPKIGMEARDILSIAVLEVSCERGSGLARDIITFEQQA